LPAAPGDPARAVRAPTGAALRAGAPDGVSRVVADVMAAE
jgi:hypothetical protein